MSDTESQHTHESFYDAESIGEEVPYINERGDQYSEESSGYHISSQANPNSNSKKYVKRLNPALEKNVRVEFFSTNPNSIIKNAVSGTLQGSNGKFFRAGSRDEDLFFSVILATGELGQNAPALFYDNPEQYERHFFTKVSDDIKERWEDKRDRALYHLKLVQKREASEANGGVVLVK
jgi:hypothetical protein